jgi:hypothetical protein
VASMPHCEVSRQVDNAYTSPLVRAFLTYPTKFVLTRFVILAPFIASARWVHIAVDTPKPRPYTHAYSHHQLPRYPIPN